MSLIFHRPFPIGDPLEPSLYNSNDFRDTVFSIECNCNAMVDMTLIQL